MLLQTRTLIRSGGRINPSCFVVQRRGAKRIYSLKLQAKMADAEERWKARADAITTGKKQSTWDLFEERGFVKDTAGTKEHIAEIMKNKRIGAYVGIDPTAPSLHVGHLLPLMPLFWMYMEGYKAFTLIGGSTAKIGDPSGRLKDREQLSSNDATVNMTKIHFQLKRLWENVDSEMRRRGYEADWARTRGIVNNNHWWNTQSLLEILKRVGHALRIGPMLSRDTVKNKLTKGDGVSFAEFTYPVMQGWDWFKLFCQRGVQMQIGGSDQYGNIISGLEIVKAARESEPDPNERQYLVPQTAMDECIGFTVPLLTDSAGNKFGKSAGNAIWLDPWQTSVFDFYGYFVRRSDEEVEKLLKLFTFMPTSEITEIMEEHAKDPRKRVAQHTLAREVSALVHGAKEAAIAQEQHRLMYSGQKTVSQPPPGRNVVAADGEQVTLNNAPRPDMILPKSLITEKPIGRILYAAGLASSSSEGHKLAVNKGCYVGAQYSAGSGELTMNPESISFMPVKLWFPGETARYLINGDTLILRKGKHNVRVIKVVSDEEYAASGETYPGQAFTGAVRKLNEIMKNLKENKLTPEEAKKAVSEVQKRSLDKQKNQQIIFPEEKSKQKKDLEKKLKKTLEESSQKVDDMAAEKKETDPFKW